MHTKGQIVYFGGSGMESIKIEAFLQPGMSGIGSGSGSGIKSIFGKTVYIVDCTQTIIHHVHGNIAKGSILHGDLTLAPCFIVRQGNLFAHGDTLRKAMKALQDKLFDNMPEDARIASFLKEHKLGTLYPNSDFFDWHHKLTGSCEMGRKAFALDHGIDLDGSMTVEEFITLTENAYGGHIIKKLRSAYDLD